MKKYLYLLTAMLLFANVALAQKTTVEISGAHLDAGLGCTDCHGTDTPEKRASQKACLECHGDMLDSAPIKFNSEDGAAFEVSPHNSHAGQIRCTLCHASHEPSKLYCNEGCHHKFILEVP